MLRDIWAFLAVGALIAGIVAQNPAIAALGVLVGAAGGGARLWARFSLRRLTYERVIPEDHAFPGERISMRLRMTNGKPLPLPWIEVRERVAGALVPDGDEEFRLAGQVEVAQTDWRTSLGAHERISRSHELECRERGVYAIGPARVQSGDPFGLFTDERAEEHVSRVVVYPRTIALDELRLPARRPYGEERGGRRIFEDPSRIVGVRDYIAGDSLRRIDWNATARLGRLQSRVYDPASSRHLLICLNTQTIEPMWAGMIADVLERSITVAASIARDAYDTRYAVGLLANSTFPDADRAIRIPPGRRPEQFIRILEALAVITPFVLEPLAAMLDREEHRLAHGTTIVVVSGLVPDELASAMLRLSRRGHAVVLFHTSDDPLPEKLSSIEVRDVSQIDAAWREPAATEAGA